MYYLLSERSCALEIIKISNIKYTKTYTVGVSSVEQPDIFPLSSPITKRSCNIECGGNKLLQIAVNMTAS